MADTVADVLLKRLREWGVRQVFGRGLFVELRAGQIFRITRQHDQVFECQSRLCTRQPLGGCTRNVHPFPVAFRHIETHQMDLMINQ